jgi:hypothetical protein
MICDSYPATSRFGFGVARKMRQPAARSASAIRCAFRRSVGPTSPGSSMRMLDASHCAITDSGVSLPIHHRSYPLNAYCRVNDAGGMCSDRRWIAPSRNSY